MNLSNFRVSKFACALLTLVLAICCANAQSYQGSNTTSVNDELLLVVGPEPLTFNDTNLATALRASLGLATDAAITEEKLKTLYSFEASYANITKLDGLEKATNLRYLDLRANGITDISALSALTELRYLDISMNNVSDGSPLEALVKLNTLSISGTLINNLDFLEPIAEAQLHSNGEYALERLYFAKYQVDRKDTGIIEIDVLSRFPKLNTIWAEYNKIKSLAPLASLLNETKALKTLILSHNYIDSISDIIPSSEATSPLVSLALDGCFLTTISGLEVPKFPNLVNINISNNFMDMADNKTDRNIIGEFEKKSPNTVIYRIQRTNIWGELTFEDDEFGKIVQNTTFFPDDDYQVIFKIEKNWIFSFKYGFIYFPDAPQVKTGYYAYFFYNTDKNDTGEEIHKDLRKWVWLDIFNMPYGNGTMYTFNPDNTISEYFGAIPTLITE